MTTEKESLPEKNIALLKHHHSEAWQVICNTADTPVGEICRSQNGQLNLKVTKNGQKIFLHPQDDPASEAMQFLGMVPESSTGVVILVGSGLCYSILSLIKNRPKIQQFLIFEPDVGIFLQALDNIDLSNLFTDPRVRLFLGPEVDIEHISKQLSKALQLENIHILKHLNLLNYSRKKYEGLYNKIFDTMLSYNMEGATLIHHGEKFLKNRFEHLRTMHHHKRLEDLQNAFKDVPAILVAAGPSLNKNIHHIYKSQGKAIIISVDSALPALLAKGIQPDFVTSIDYGNFTYEKIASSAPASKHISLICMPWVNINVTKKFPAENVFWGFSSASVEEWMNRVCGGSLSVGGAGTVAHLNLIASIVMGCRPHILIGQDLSYSGKTDHAENVFLGYSEDMKKAMEQDDSPRIKGLDGTLLPTRNDFINYKNMFEKIIAANPGLYINSTARGAHIEGTEVLPIEKAIEKYCGDAHHTVQIQKSLAQKEAVDFQRITNEIHALTDNIRQIQPVFKKNQKNLKEALREVLRLKKRKNRLSSFADLPQHLQKKISKIDGYNKKIDDAGILWSILESITMEELRNSERMLDQIRRIENDPSKYLEYLEKNLIRLIDINTVRHNCVLTLNGYLKSIRNFHQKEKNLLAKTDQSNSDTTAQFQLAKLYFDHGDLTLAKPLFKKSRSADQSAETLFHLGCIAGYQTDFSSMEEYFKNAVTKNNSMKTTIDQFRDKIARQYAGYSEWFFQEDKRNCIQFLIKGAKYNKDYPDIKNRLQQYFETDLEKAVSLLQTGNTHFSDALILDWEKEMDDNPILEKILRRPQLKIFFTACGRASLATGNLDKALVQFQKAVQYDPADPELLVLLADTHFTGGELTQGAVYLEKAVSIDKTHAKYWEILGDALFKAQNYDQGATAYENCFIAAPENIQLLKKIGDCYLANGQMEAAKEAYQQYKNALENSQC